MLFIITKLCTLSNRIFKKYRYDISRSKLIAKYYASVFDRKLKAGNYDIIFAPAASTEIAYLDTKLPICYYSDTSVSQIRDYYNTFSNLIKISENETELIQSRALQKSKIVIHSSEWATRYVVENYGVKETQAFTVALGANIDEAPGRDVFEAKMVNKNKCNLLLLGMNWERKGGAIAFEALRELINLGVDATLTICGCVPPAQFRHDKMIVIPFLDKNNEEHYNQFLQLLRDTHFLILPTRAECSAIVYAEASAYGIPSITTATGGVASMIEDNVNGFMLPLEAGGAEYARVIKELFMNDEKYAELVYSSRAKYDNELNWNTWGKRIKDIITSEL